MSKLILFARIHEYVCGPLCTCFFCLAVRFSCYNASNLSALSSMFMQMFLRHIARRNCKIIV